MSTAPAKDVAKDKTNPKEVNVESTLVKLENFIDDKINLSGTYPDIPLEVYEVFLGTSDGIIDPSDITAELPGFGIGVPTGTIGKLVYTNFLATLPVSLQPLFGYYVSVYLFIKTYEIYNILGFTQLFNIPTVVTDIDKDDLSFKGLKKALDDSMTSMKKEIEKQWDAGSQPENKAEKEKKDKEKADHEKQIVDKTGLEKILSDIKKFTINPTKDIPPFTKAQEKMSLMELIHSKFDDVIKKATDHLKHMDIEAIIASNYEVSKQKKKTVESNIPKSCDAMIAVYDQKIIEAEMQQELNPGIAYMYQPQIDKWEQLKKDLLVTKEKAKIIAENAAADMDKKDIKLLGTASKREFMMSELTRISIEYNKSISALYDITSINFIFNTCVLSTKLLAIETNRVISCIRVFNKFPKINDIVGNETFKSLQNMDELKLPNMSPSEFNQFTNSIVSEDSDSDIMKKTNMDRLSSVASDINAEAQDIIDMTDDSDTTKSNKLKVT